MKNKIFYLFFIFLFIFASVLPVHAESDTTPPNINNISLSKTEVRPGDILTITIEASDTESGFDESTYCSIELYNGSRYISLLHPKYNLSTGNFKLNYQIPSDVQSGNWYISQITLYDKAGNHKFLNNNDPTKYNFTVTGGTNDITPPVINNIAFSKTEVKQGDTLLIAIEASDTESDFDESTYCSIELFNGSRYISLLHPKYNLSTGNFELNYQIPSDVQSGNWYISQITLYDKAGNHKFLNNNDPTKYNFTVTGGTNDITPPVINNIAFSKTEVKQGDTLLIAIETSDTESGFDENTYCSIELYNGSRYISLLHPKYNLSTGNFQLNYQIPSDMQSGNWYISQITLYDKAGNHKLLNNNYPTKYNFSVKSIFQGTENISLIVGSNFNPLQGVEAINEFEGNISSNISYEGFIDTGKMGLYLIKYTVTGINGIYVDYRWVSIVSNLACNDNEHVAGRYFSNSISLNLSNLVNLNSINLTKDGNSYVLGDNSTISEEGKYVLSFNSNVNPVNFMERSLKASLAVLSESSTNIQPSNFEFTIDKTSPEVIEVYPQTIDEGTQISADKFVKAVDNSKLRYDYLTEPLWTKIGEQNVQIAVKDLAGNQVTKDIKLTIVDKCDIDRDNRVSIIDLASIAQNYNVKSTQVNWNSRFDFNKDNIIDIFDLVTCSKRLK